MLVYGLFVDVLQRECIISWPDMGWKMRAAVCTYFVRMCFNEYLCGRVFFKVTLRIRIW